MEVEEFEEIVAEVLQSLPGEFKNQLGNLLIVTQEVPDDEQRRILRLRRHVILYGLYQGIPLTISGRDKMVRPPDTITIFRDPIIQTNQSIEGVRSQIKSTVLHEIGHYFGMSEIQLRNLHRKYD